MSMKPALSVVVPVYNKKGFVGAAIRSVLTQTFSDFELILVDDGSTDGGLEESTIPQDNRIRVIRQANAGVAAARNRGIAAAEAEWVALLDADDLWMPGHLREIERAILSFPEAGLVATRVWTTPVELPPQPEGEAKVQQIDYIGAAARHSQIVTSSTVALRRSCVQEIGGFRNLRPGEDIDCWVRMSLRWATISNDQLTALYVRGTGGHMDRWYQPAGRRTREVTSLRAFGGTVQILADALGSGKYEDRRAVFEQYMDARILDNAGRSLRLGDRTGARARLRFVHDKRRRRYWALRLMAGGPRGLTSSLIALRRRLRG